MMEGDVQIQQASGQTGAPLTIGDWFEVDFPMRWADADMLQHVNNAVYFRYMEEARIHLMAAAGMRANDETGKVVAHCSCDFIRPITYPATVRVRLVIEKVGRTSLTKVNEIFVTHDLGFGPYARGKTVLVNIESSTGKPVVWSEADLVTLGAACQRAT
jgi:acyl-CoA thioester hydrolase